MSNFIESLINGNLEDFRKNIQTALYAKAEEALNERKVDVSAALYSGEEQIEEELKGNQHKIDANKNGKIDAGDFKLLRKKKK